MKLIYIVVILFAIFLFVNKGVTEHFVPAGVSNLCYQMWESLAGSSWLCSAKEAQIMRNYGGLVTEARIAAALASGKQEWEL